jgi:hypothetical protein
LTGLLFEGILVGRWIVPGETSRFRRRDSAMRKSRTAVVASAVLVVLVAACWCLASRRDVVHNSVIDGSVWQIRHFLRHNWKDFEARPAIEWGQVRKTPEGNFLAPCTFLTTRQGKPAVIEAVFTFDHNGQFVDVKTTQS